MTTMTTDLAPLTAARTAAQRLTVQQKVQLISELVQEIALGAAPQHAPSTAEDELDQLMSAAVAADPAFADSADVLAEMRQKTGFARLRVVAADIHAHYPNADVGARLEADRRERDGALRGEGSDVHA